MLSGSKRVREHTSKLKDYYVYNIEESLHKCKNYKEIMNSSNSFEWLRAMEEEINSINKNKVWELVDLPLGINSL